MCPQGGRRARQASVWHNTDTLWYYGSPMNLDILAELSWREALVGLVALLVIYLALVYLRFRRLKSPRPAPEVPASAAVSASAVAAYAAVQTVDAAADAPVATNLGTTPAASAAPADSFDFPWNEPPLDAHGKEKMLALETELAQLRREVGGLRAEVLVLREAQQKAQAEPPAAMPASPLYSDAMQMATQGRDADSISQHCGISRAEAELVVALVRNRDNGR